jgi:hypothetical protein
VKRQTKAQKCKDLGNAVIQIREGKKVKRVGARDGSIPTHPVVSVDPTKSEKIVLMECLAWLNINHVKCNRHDAGTFQNKFGQYGTYGILGSGDIHGMLRHHDGKHFEIECKKGKGGRLSKAQQKRRRDVEYNNGLYFVVHGVEELIYYMGCWV